MTNTEQTRAFMKNLREVISFAKTRNMDILEMYTPDLPAKFDGFGVEMKRERIFGVECKNFLIKT